MVLKEEKVFVTSGKKKGNARTNVVSGVRVTIVQNRHQRANARGRSQSEKLN